MSQAYYANTISSGGKTACLQNTESKPFIGKHMSMPLEIHTRTFVFLL